MSWKDISKSSYTVESTKFTLARPSHPFTIPYQGPKVRYSEGDEMTSVTDYRFNLDFTGEPLDDRHFPCGYWHKNYIPPQTVIYTSLLYPLEVFDYVETTNVNIVSGEFKAIIQTYDCGYEIVETSTVDLVSGKFADVYLTYSLHESVETSNVNLVSGQFKDALWSYIVPAESVETSTINLVSGYFKDIFINYPYAAPESIETSSINIVSGVHES